LCKEKSISDLPYRGNVSSILVKSLYTKYSNSENQSKLLKSLLSKETLQSPLKKNLAIVVICNWISDYLNETQENSNKDFLQNSLQKNEIFQINFFDEQLIPNKGKMINYCNEYFSADSTLVMKDFLESNFVIVRKSSIFNLIIIV